MQIGRSYKNLNKFWNLLQVLEIVKKTLLTVVRIHKIMIYFIIKIKLN